MSVVDIHNHLMPAVDDGARTPEDSVAALGRMREAGVVALVTTPHFDGSLTQDPKAQAKRLEELDQGWERLVEAGRGGGVELHRGVEVLLDVPDPHPEDPRLRINGGPFVLVEFPSMTVPPGATRPLEVLRAGGWIPVLAHPERYHSAGSTPEETVAEARRWRDAGAYLQVNGPALLGRYGPDARMRAFALLEAGMVDYLGSDYHSRGEPRIVEYVELLRERGFDAGLALLTDGNPRRMLDGKPPLPVPPLPVVARSLLDRLLRKR
jgi:protein-tyrosine phosphatase